MRRIHWSAFTGLGGRHAPDSVAALHRITQFEGIDKLPDDIEQLQK